MNRLTANNNGFAAIETVLVLVIVGILGFTGWFVWHSKQVTVATLQNAATTSPATAKPPTNFLKCTKYAGSKFLGTNPEQCVAKTGKHFTNEGQAPEPSLGPNPGSITGSLGFPASGNPSQKVCAELIGNTAVTFCTITQPAQSTYALKVAPGDYHVYASLMESMGDFKISTKAYYNEHVRCGTNVDCPRSGHTTGLPVTVTAGQTVAGVDPKDWYATD